MYTNRRDALRHLGFGAITVGAGLLPARGFAYHADHHRSQAIPPAPTNMPMLKAQPPYRHTQVKLEIRHQRLNTKNKLRPRTLRAQSTLDTPGNRRDLALTMWGEARGYGTQGMRAIGHVIMNRVKADRSMFGRGIHKVCHKDRQFSCWNKNDPNRKQMEKLPNLSEHHPDWLAFLKADKLAGQILSGADKDNTGGATFYHAEGMIPYWRKDMIPVGVMFGHIFYKPKLRPRVKHKTHRHTHDSHHDRRPIHHYDHSHASHHR